MRLTPEPVLTESLCFFTFLISLIHDKRKDTKNSKGTRTDEGERPFTLKDLDNIRLFILFNWEFVRI